MSSRRTPATLTDFVVVTFNTGIPQCSRAAGKWYGTGLAFKVWVGEARHFFDGLQPDMVAFQEMFYSGE